MTELFRPGRVVPVLARPREQPSRHRVGPSRAGWLGHWLHGRFHATFCSRVDSLRLRDGRNGLALASSSVVHGLKVVAAAVVARRLGHGQVAVVPTVCGRASLWSPHSVCWRFPNAFGQSRRHRAGRASGAVRCARRPTPASKPPATSGCRSPLAQPPGWCWRLLSCCCRSLLAATAPRWRRRSRSSQGRRTGVRGGTSFAPSPVRRGFPRLGRQRHVPGRLRGPLRPCQNRCSPSRPTWAQRCMRQFWRMGRRRDVARGDVPAAFLLVAGRPVLGGAAPAAVCSAPWPASMPLSLASWPPHMTPFGPAPHPQQGRLPGTCAGGILRLPGVWTVSPVVVVCGGLQSQAYCTCVAVGIIVGWHSERSAQPVLVLSPSRSPGQSVAPLSRRQWDPAWPTGLAPAA